MNEKEGFRVLTIDEFLERVNVTNQLALVIQGHNAIDTALSVLISESLPEPHAVEIERLSFGLKFDLSVALNLIPHDSRPAFFFFNKIRNKFAHKPVAEIKRKDITDFINVLSQSQRDAFKKLCVNEEAIIDLMRCGIAIMHYEVVKRIKAFRDLRIETEATMEFLEDKTSKRNLKVSTKTRREINEKILQKRTLEKKWKKLYDQDI